jgi:hypothetical protein
VVGEVGRAVVGGQVADGVQVVDQGPKDFVGGEPTFPSRAWEREGRAGKTLLKNFNKPVDTVFLP